jgi:hypothetical protein
LTMSISVQNRLWHTTIERFGTSRLALIGLPYGRARTLRGSRY